MLKIKVQTILFIHLNEQLVLIHTRQKSHLQDLTLKFVSTSFYIGLWLTIKDDFTKKAPNLC